MGTPPNGVAVGVPGGGPAARTPPWPAMAFVAVACSIRDAVQNSRAACCAGWLMTCTVPMAGLEGAAAGWMAAVAALAAVAGLAASRDTATTSEKAWGTYHC